MANISQVYLLDTPLESDMKHTLYFSSLANQHSYMASKVIKTYTNVSYQRDTSTFRCPAHLDTIRQCNYMMYQNSAYSNKWFYCFIEKMTYISDGLTDVEFKVDPIQTFMFDFDTQPSFIEREHTNNDAIGSNTVPENIELGDYVETDLAPQNAFELGTGQTRFAIAFTRLVDRLNNNYNPIKLTSIPDGFVYLGVDSITDLNNMITFFNKEGHPDYIDSIFVVPKDCFTNKVTYYNEQQNISFYTNYDPRFEDSVAVTTNNRLAGNYSPRNAKLLTYPYRYLQMSNNSGSVANYYYEYFKDPLTGNIDTTPEFEFKGYACAGCDAKAYPRQYKGIYQNYDEGLTFGKLPVGGWASDVYTNWLTQNGVNIATGFVSDIASIGVGLATAPAGGGVGVIGGITGIANRLGQVYQHSMMPPQAEGGTNAGNSTYAWGYSHITFKHMSIKKPFAQIIDDYFDMFGYATHRVKKPNYAHRQNWWYTKTIDIYIKGNIPNEYMDEIKNAYNNGITYWRNPSNFMNYSVSNGIV